MRKVLQPHGCGGGVLAAKASKFRLKLEKLGFSKSTVSHWFGRICLLYIGILICHVLLVSAYSYL